MFRMRPCSSRSQARFRDVGVLTLFKIAAKQLRQRYSRQRYRSVQPWRQQAGEKVEDLCEERNGGVHPQAQRRAGRAVPVTCTCVVTDRHLLTSASVYGPQSHARISAFPSTGLAELERLRTS